MTKYTCLEIERLIAEIEGLTPATNEEMFSFGVFTNNWYVKDKDTVDGSPVKLVQFNPLTDKALCFDLMIKHRVRLCPEYDGGWTAFILIEGKEYVRVHGKKAQESICLAIIENHRLQK